MFPFFPDSPNIAERLTTDKIEFGTMDCTAFGGHESWLRFQHLASGQRRGTASYKWAKIEAPEVDVAFPLF